MTPLTRSTYVAQPVAWQHTIRSDLTSVRDVIAFFGHPFLHYCTSAGSLDSAIDTVFIEVTAANL